MIGRTDTESTVCPSCNGNKKDPRKRSRNCPRCSGLGIVERCKSCGEVMPCPGTDAHTFDQSLCSKGRYTAGQHVLFLDDNQCEIVGVIKEVRKFSDRFVVIVALDSGGLYEATLLKGTGR